MKQMFDREEINEMITTKINNIPSPYIPARLYIHRVRLAHPQVADKNVFLTIMNTRAAKYNSFDEVYRDDKKYILLAEASKSNGVGLDPVINAHISGVDLSIVMINPQTKVIDSFVFPRTGMELKSDSVNPLT